jgi:hypothetical protein
MVAPCPRRLRLRHHGRMAVRAIARLAAVTRDAHVRRLVRAELQALILDILRVVQDAGTMSSVTSDSHAPEGKDGATWRDREGTERGSSEPRIEGEPGTSDTESSSYLTEFPGFAALRKELRQSGSQRRSGAKKQSSKGQP